MTAPRRNHAEPLLVLTITGPRFSSNDRLHWAEKAHLTQWWRDGARVRARAMIGTSWTPPERARVLVEFIPGSRRRVDPGNAAPAAKAAIDGLVLAGVLIDDDAAHLDGPDYRLAPGPPVRQWLGMWTLRFTITEVTGAAEPDTPAPVASRPAGRRGRGPGHSGTPDPASDRGLAGGGAVRHGSLFSGYGGLDLAVAEVLSADMVWHCETDRAASAVLARHWPGVPNLGDITAVDWSVVEPVDVLSGGFPCQGLSLAGRRAGLADARSGLWSYMAAAVAALRPPLVIIENVAGLLSTRAGQPIPEEDDDDLAVGDVGPADPGVGDGAAGHLRAVGAVLGELAELGYDATWCGLPASAVGAPHRRFRVFILATLADSSGDPVRLQPVPVPGSGGATVTGHVGSRAAAHPACHRWDEGRPEPAGFRRGPDAALSGSGVDWREYAPAVARWERVTGRLAPPPAEPGPRGGRPRLSPAFPEWMMGLPAGWITDTPGVTRTDALRLCGNGVVPLQAAAALRWLLAVHFGREAAA